MALAMGREREEKFTVDSDFNALVHSKKPKTKLSARALFSVIFSKRKIMGDKIFVAIKTSVKR